MATATRPRNRARVLTKILGAILYAKEIDDPQGGAGQMGYLRKKVWVCAGVPAGAIPDGMLAYDLILDTTNDDVYRFITGTTYVKMNTTS